MACHTFLNLYIYTVGHVDDQDVLEFISRKRNHNKYHLTTFDT